MKLYKQNTFPCIGWTAEFSQKYMAVSYKPVMLKYEIEWKILWENSRGN